MAIPVFTAANLASVPELSVYPPTHACTVVLALAATFQLDAWVLVASEAHAVLLEVLRADTLVPALVRFARVTVAAETVGKVYVV